jgi:hypothetical protein
MSYTGKLTNKQLDDIEKFNNAIKGILTLVGNMDPGNILIDSVRRQISLVLETNPVDPIKVSGPYIKKYSAAIKERKEPFGDIAKDMANASPIISNIFDIIKNKWPSLNEAEKNKYWARLDILNSCI